MGIQTVLKPTSERVEASCSGSVSQSLSLGLKNLILMGVCGVPLQNHSSNT